MGPDEIGPLFSTLLTPLRLRVEVNGRAVSANNNVVADTSKEANCLLDNLILFIRIPRIRRIMTNVN